MRKEIPTENGNKVATQLHCLSSDRVLLFEQKRRIECIRMSNINAMINEAVKNERRNQK